MTDGRLAILEVEKERNPDAPNPLDERPVLPRDLLSVRGAFSQLCLGRPVGFSPSGLRPVDVLAWLIIHEVPQGDWSRWYGLLAAQDAEWMKLSREAGESDDAEGEDNAGP